MRIASFLAFAFICGLTFCIARAAVTEEKNDGGQKDSFTGVLIDQACGSKMTEKDNPEEAAAAHTKSCAMKDACQKSGYGLISGKVLLRFDENGNKLAKDYLQSAQEDNNLRVTVMGERQGDSIKVTSIKKAS
jgi:hypothetical protein